MRNFYDPSAAIAEAPSEWTEFHGVQAWRLKADYYSQDFKAADA
jgi:hypothetical protein